LVDTGFLQAQPVRRGTRGSREIPYLATEKSWQLSNPSGGRIMLESFLHEVALVPATEIDTARLGLRLPPHEWEEFKDRLAELLDEFAQRPDDPHAAPFSVFIAMHPDAVRARTGT
jgi:hypothetical protein